MLARQDLLATASSSKLPSVPKKGTDFYHKAKEYAEQLKSGAMTSAQYETLLAKKAGPA